MNDPVEAVFDGSYAVYTACSGVVEKCAGYLYEMGREVDDWVWRTGKSPVEQPLKINRSPGLFKGLVRGDHQEMIIAIATGSCAAFGWWWWWRWSSSGSRGSGIGGGIGSWSSNGRNRSLGKRRAHKLRNGARYQVVLVVGNALNASVQRMINDLSQRGFIVFITVSTESELKVVEAEDSSDIRPLLISYESPKTVKEALTSFRSILTTPVQPFPGADDHCLYLKAVLVVPEYHHFPKGLVEEIPTREWQRILNTQLLNTLSLCYNGLFKLIRDSNSQKSSILSFNSSEDEDEDEQDMGQFQIDKDLGGDTKLIFINFINSLNNSQPNFHIVEQVSIALKRKLFSSIYNDINYMNSVDIPQRSNLLKRLFLPRLKSPNHINVSQLVINYSSSSPSTRFTDSVYLSSSLYIPSTNQNIILKLWSRLKNLLLGSNHKISPTRLHHKIFDMIYSTRNLSKNYFISSNGLIYDFLSSLAI